MGDVLEERVRDLERRLARVIQTGVIAAADYDTARVRVRIGERLSDWLPWTTRRAGNDVDWWPPEIGEQVEVCAPNGEMSEARVTPAFYSDAVPAPANSPAIRLVRFGNGTEIRHDREKNRLSIETPDDVDLSAAGYLIADIGKSVALTAQGAVTVTTPAQVTVDAPKTTFTGAVTIQGALTYQGGMAGSGGSGAAATIDGDVQTTGRMKADGDVIAGGTSLQNHTHPGDSSGTTGAPN